MSIHGFKTALVGVQQFSGGVVRKRASEPGLPHSRIVSDRIKVTAGMKRTPSLNRLISIFIAHGKLDELWLDFLAGLEPRAAAEDHQIAFLQSGKNFIFVRCFQAERNGALFDLVVRC